MELIQKYVYQIYNDKSFTKAAKKLFVSQPALSSAVSKHEKKLGFKIFDRSKSPLRLTPEGRILIESYEEIMQAEDSADRRIKQLSQHRKNELTVGGASSSLYLLLPAICGEFHKKDPSVCIRICIDTLNRESARSRVHKGDVDLVIDYVKGDEGCENVLIAEDDMIAAVPKSMVKGGALSEYASNYEDLDKKDGRRRVKDVSLFGDIQFLSFVKNGKSMSKKMSEIFGDRPVPPVNVESSPNTIIHHYLAKHGCGALLTNVIAAKELFCRDDGLCYFFLDNENAKRPIYIIKKAGSASDFADRFVECAKELFGTG